MERREYAGGAQATTLSGGMAQGATTAQINGTAGWPTGSVGPFFVVIDRGLPGEEKVLVTSRSGSVLNVAPSGRGSDGTTDTAHSLGAAIEHCHTATDADEANAHANATANVHGLTGGDVVVGVTAAQTLTNKTISGAANSLSNIPQSAVTNLVANLAAKAADSAVVKLTGAQTVAGAKTFSDALAASSTATVAGALTVAGATSLQAVTTTALTVGGLDPLSPPRFRGYRSVAATIATGNGITGYLPVSLDLENHKVGVTHSTSVNSSRVTIVTTGLYNIAASAAFTAESAGLRLIQIRKNAAGDTANGTQLVVNGVPPQSSAVSGVVQCDAGDVALTAGDYVEMFVAQTSGSSLDVLGSGVTWMNVRLVAV